MVLKCTCTGDKRGNSKAAQYQDKKYGEFMRVHNKGGKSSPPTYSCTVCGHTRGA
ncbi:MAG: hypothetical protein WDA42_07595 [Candidatus Bathyarchaeia archaeon]|jgi:hypothetical protein